MGLPSHAVIGPGAQPSALAMGPSMAHATKAPCQPLPFRDCFVSYLHSTTTALSQLTSFDSYCTDNCFHSIATALSHLVHSTNSLATRSAPSGNCSHRKHRDSRPQSHNHPLPHVRQRRSYSPVPRGECCQPNPTAYFPIRELRYEEAEQ